MKVREYTDFDVAIEAEGESFVAKVLASPAGQASGHFSLPFSAIELENFVLKVGRTRSGVRKMGSPEGTAAELFGKKLYEAVFAGEVGIAFRRSIDDADLANRGLRVRIRTADAPTLSNIPWEFVWAEGLGRFVALSNQTPVIRYIDLPTRIRPLAVKPPLRILLMVSNPVDVDRLDVQREVELLKEATKDLVSSGRVELVVMEDANMTSLAQRLRREEFHIFHFIGHGGFADGDGVLVLEDNMERARRVKGQHLGTIFHDHGSLRLAVLNACEGARASAEDPFSGVAPSLVRQGIPAVIAMQFEITDAAAIQFAHEFYQAVADGYPVDAAVTEARKGIFSADNDLEWATPVLYMRAPDGMIFDVTAPPVPPPVVEEKPAPPEPKLEPDPDPAGPEPARAAPPEAPPIDRSKVEGVSPSAPELDPATEYEKALGAIDSRSWPEAVRRLEKVLALDPGKVAARTHLEDAKRRVRAAALVIEGRAAHGAGRWEEALASLREAAGLDPDFVDEDGLMADAAWRVEVLRQPAEEAKESRPEPEPVRPAPAAASPQPPLPTPESEGLLPSPVSIPPPQSRPVPPARRRRSGVVVGVLVGVPLLVLMIITFIVLAAAENDATTTTAFPETTFETDTFPETTFATTPPETTVTEVELPPGDIVAVFMPTPPLVDGDASDWFFEFQAFSDDVVAQEVEMPWLPTGLWGIGWDNDALYVFVDVFDPEVHQPWINQPDQLWQGDSVNFEFGFDPTDLDTSQGVRPDDLHVLLGPWEEPGFWQAIVAVNRVVDGAISAGNEEPEIEAVSTMTDTPGYWIEAKIPWHVLGVFDPAVGDVYGMNVNVSDGDGSFRVMVSSNLERVQTRPGTWDTLVLGP